MKNYDVIVIGLGSAGMAAANMAFEMELKVLAVESRKIGGECNSESCIPSPALLMMSDNNPLLTETFARINVDIHHIREDKIMALADKTDVLLGQGEAAFVNENTIRVADKQYTAKSIFIATGTRPVIPPIKGLDEVNYLTNENLFLLQSIPKSMTFIGGGTIGCEMAQAFAKAGCQCTIVHDQPYLIPDGERKSGEMLEKSCKAMGIEVHHSCVITHIEKENDQVILHTRDGLKIQSEKLMVTAGRMHDFSSLHLENAKVAYNRNGIIVDDYLRTSNKQIYAIGDCNGSYLLSNAAKHQGILALMNAIAKSALRKKYRKYPLPWTVFTQPQISHVGKTSHELDSAGIDYEVIETTYNSEDLNWETNGASEGLLQIFCSSKGKIYGVSIAGAKSKEMINEWTAAMQHNIDLFDLMETIHSFPFIGALIQHISKTGVVDKNRSKFSEKLLRLFF